MRGIVNFGAAALAVFFGACSAGLAVGLFGFKGGS
jgi:hypothetical protein